MLLIFLPVSAVIVVLSVPMAQAVFQTGGKMGAADVVLAGQVNAIYSAVLPFYALETIMMQAYFSSRRVFSVSAIGIFFSAISMLVSYIGVVQYKLEGSDALMLVALGFTVSRVLKSIALIVVLKATGLPLMPFKPMLSFLIRAAILTAACGGACLGALHLVEKMQPEIKNAKPAEASGKSNEEWKTLDEAKTEPAESKSGEKTEESAADEKSSAKTAAPKPAAKSDAPAQESKGETVKAPAAGSSTLRTLMRAGPQLALPGLVAAIVFVLGCKLLRLEEFDEMLKYAKEKLRRRGKKKSPENPA
jgi:hypothetical protein